MPPVHHRAQDLPRKRLQLCVGTVLECHFAHVPANIEGRVVFPGWKANIKERGHHSLEVAGNKWQLRLDKLDESLERDLSLKNTDTGHVEGHALAFQMEENSIPPGKAVILLLALHRSSPSQLPIVSRRTIAHLRSRTKTATSALPA